MRSRKLSIPLTRAGLLGLAALALGAAPASAAVGGFEGSDGNQTCNAALPTVDWACFTQVTGRPIVGTPDASGSNDDQVSGKENAPGGWTIVSGSVQTKSDITGLWRASTEPTPGNSFLNLALKRVADGGQAFFAFELNQKRTTFVNAVHTRVPCRTNGDVLVAYDITTSPTISLRKWVGSPGSGDPSDGSCPGGATGTWVAGLANTPASEAALNAVEIANSLPGATGPFPIGTFGEASLDIAGIAGDLHFTKPCELFTSLQARSRASSSDSADLRDIVASTNISVAGCEPPSGGGGGGGGTGGGPAAPVITAGPACVVASSVPVSGTGPVGSQILVADGGESVGIAEVGADGTWSTVVPAGDGAHSYTATAVDKTGTSAASSPVAVLVDTKTACGTGGGSANGGGSGTGTGGNGAGGTVNATGGTKGTTGTGATASPLAALKILGVSAGCHTRPFTSYVADTRKLLARVVFKVDGKTVATVRKRDRLGKFLVRIDPRKYAVGNHRLTVTLVANAKGVKARTVVKPFKRCSSCVSRRSFVIHLVKPHGEALASAQVFVNGKKVKVLTGKRLKARVTLTGLPQGTYKVRIRVVTVTGRAANSTRTYHTCLLKATPKKKKA